MAGRLRMEEDLGFLNDGAETLDTDELFKLLRDGTLSNCIAIVSQQRPDSVGMKELCETAKIYFRNVVIHQMGNGSVKSFSDSQPDLLLIHGLEKCDPKSAEAYSVRSSIDVQRTNGITSVICLGSAAYKKHFCDRENHFYQFCGIVDTRRRV